MQGCPLWVNNCRASFEAARPLYPQKLPRHSFAVAAVKGHLRRFEHLGTSYVFRLGVIFFLTS
jgi:hypothetical protein